MTHVFLCYISFYWLFFTFSFPCNCTFFLIAFLLMGIMFFGPFFPFKLLVNESKKNGAQHADELSSWNQGDVGPQISRQGQRRFKCRL